MTVQFTGSPVPLTTKPKLVLAPGASAPFQDWLTAVTCWPEVVRRASQNEPSVLPAGRSNWTFHEEMAAELSLVTVNRASYPLLQLEVRTKAAVAAEAGGAASRAPATTAVVSAAASVARRGRSLTASSRGRAGVERNSQPSTCAYY